MGMKPKRLSDLLILAGLALAVAGIALIYPPAALIVGGAGLAAFGLFVIEMKP
jgi:hypothetical protein